MAQTEDTSPCVYDKGVGALLYVGRAVNNKLLVALSSIGSQKSAATIKTSEAI